MSSREGPFRAGLLPSTFRREEQAILPLHEDSVETHDRRGLEYDSASSEPKRADAGCTEAGNEAIDGSQIRCSLAGPIKDQQLMPEQDGLGKN